MDEQRRIENEISHGKFIAKRGEEIWNWSSPAGILRWKRRIELFKEFLGNNKKNVLEIGCGTGLFTEEIVKTDNYVTAVDISNELLEIAKKRVKALNVNFLQENACDTKFPDNSYDFIIGSSILHHLNINSALKEFSRLLKPGGWLMFTEPNMMNPQIALQKNIPFLKKISGDSPDETAFIRWSLKKKIIHSGFQNVTVTPFDFMHPAVPKSLIKITGPLFNFFEKIPLVREIAGSLIIKASKD